MIYHEPLSHHIKHHLPSWNIMNHHLWWLCMTCCPNALPSRWTFEPPDTEGDTFPDLWPTDSTASINAVISRLKLYYSMIHSDPTLNYLNDMTTVGSDSKILCARQCYGRDRACTRIVQVKWQTWQCCFSGSIIGILVAKVVKPIWKLPLRTVFLKKCI